MSKQLTYLVLIISLVGQLLLTPAMAMPSLLHAFSHVQMMTVDNHSSEMIKLLSTPHQSTLLVPVSSHSNTTVESIHNQQSCGMIISNIPMPADVGITIDCDALCEMMGSGDCVSHCANATGILIQAQFALVLPESSAAIQTRSWSTQTAEPVPFTPPPMQIV
ncbi:hypothetical protein HWQ46_20590 [Shewanella sp. D64]|uniref:hypothetical protein n=1 Tax=unclassified Shewanella TaxID=196818 RepID=UPI0022BA3FE8|nr:MULTISPECIES: hypothetical protein [unclassified Shewanella]MEC4727937.1 hypothetical protein [Shewanella sp. D64]MEC4740091.1 hypothetical protein [Shewanella sp. E94]WBJ95860.1 hypothetical protein HWQ47_01600 [Shewanella sp. MTB7]